VVACVDGGRGIGDGTIFDTTRQLAVDEEPHPFAKT